MSCSVHNIESIIYYFNNTQFRFSKITNQNISIACINIFIQKGIHIMDNLFGLFYLKVYSKVINHMYNYIKKTPCTFCDALKMAR